MQQQWFLVRGRQAELLAEAEQERLARRAREAQRSELSMEASAIVQPTVLKLAGRRLMAVGSAEAGKAALRPCDSPEG